MRISELLPTSGDRLALAQISRWHYSVLGHTAYTHIIVSQGLKIAPLIATLIANHGRCEEIFHLDIIIPEGSKFSSYDDASIRRSQERDLVHGAIVVLKVAINLKSVHLQNPQAYHTEYGTVDILIRDPYPFRLTSFSAVRASEGTLEFVRNQTELVHLTVLSAVSDFTIYEVANPLSISGLRTLWATPGWSRIVLPNSPVQSFGLVHDEPGEKERRDWRATVDSLIKIGGHSTVGCLTLPYEDFFWDHQVVKLSEYGLAFPSVTKLCITLAGFGAERLVS